MIGVDEHLLECKLCLLEIPGPHEALDAITQLAEQLDRGTLDLAVKIVPVARWEARLGTTVHVGDGAPTRALTGNSVLHGPRVSAIWA